MHIKRNEKQVYVLEIVFAVAILIFALFFLTITPSIKNYYLVVVLGALLFAAICLFGYHRDKHYLRTYVSRIVIACLMLTAIVCFALGLLLNYTHSSFSLVPATIFSGCFPILLISIETEVLRYIVFHTYFRSRKPVVIFTIISIVMNVVAASYASSFVSPEAVFIMICTVVLPVLATELLCSYLCYKIGLQPALIYKIVVRIYPFVLPILPNLGAFIYAVVTLLLPTVIFLFTNNLHLANRQDQKRIRHRNQLIITIPTIAVLLAVVALVSGIFQHQIIAIASDSMQPTFSRGDAVIFVKCSSDDIREDDILVFKHEGVLVTHRVKQIDTSNNRRSFITQGDNNPDVDQFSTSDSQVLGRVVVINKYIGFPTVWLNEKLKAE